MEPNKVFRQAALDRLASPEQLHTLMRVTDAKGWLALVGGALILCAAVTWGIFGSIRTKVSAPGILLSGGALTELTAEGEGNVSAIDVKAGDVVKKGQRIATVAQPGLSQEIEALKSQISGFMPSADAGAFATFRDERRRRLERDLERMQKHYAETAEVESNVDGRVVEVRATVGQHVVAGAPIVALERVGEDADIEALLYFDSQHGKALATGMQVQLVPSGLRQSGSGTLLGRVKSVENFPSTRLGMMSALRNEQLVEYFIQATGGAPLAVRAQLIADPKTPSGYRWSSGAGPDVKLTSGTPCVGAVITRLQRPIALVFPALDDGG